MSDPAIRPYRPANASDATDFEARWCDRCSRWDEERGCPISNAAFRYEIGSPGYPPEWITDAIIGPRCTAFAVPVVGSALDAEISRPLVPLPGQMDLFGSEAS